MPVRPAGQQECRPLNQIVPISKPRLNIAVIGTGIAGMASAWMLSRNHHVTVYEREPRIGGHSNTVEMSTRSGTVPVDTGFIVYNERNYPNLTALFAHLGVPTKASDMSFSASLAGGAFEYSGTGPNGLLGQRRNVVRPRFWRMIRELLRFYREAPALLDDANAEELSFGTYLRRHGYGTRFIRDHLLPMGAAIWSTTPADMEAYPAKSFIRFFVSHGLLELQRRPQWRTVDGGSKAYVARLTAPYRDRIRFGGVRAIRRGPNGVTVADEFGAVQQFDHVVVATHADQAYRLLADPDPLEDRILGCWRYTENRAVLHRDPTLMPKRRRVWSSWNFIEGVKPHDDTALCVTYWMNRLQSLPCHEQVFVTLNPVHDPAPGTVIQTFNYTHPYFDRQALRSQQDLWSLQGRRRTWFCGSYFGHGFHEDALQSGLAVAERLGGERRPWTVPGENGRIRITETDLAITA